MALNPAKVPLGMDLVRACVKRLTSDVGSTGTRACLSASMLYRTSLHLRRGYALTSLEFEARMDGTGQKISKRLDVFC